MKSWPTAGAHTASFRLRQLLFCVPVASRHGDWRKVCRNGEPPGCRSKLAAPTIIECLLLAQSGHFTAAFQCLLLGVKRTSSRRASMSAYDPKRTSTIVVVIAPRGYGYKSSNPKHGDRGTRWTVA